MKLKHGTYLMGASIAIFAILRTLQKMLVIAEDGFFIKETWAQTLLSDSLYWLMGAVAIVSLLLRLGKTNRTPAQSKYFCNIPVLICSALVAVSLLVYGVVALISRQWIGAFAVGGAIYFILLTFRADGLELAVLKVAALLGLAYPCAAAVNGFFSTFREIKASENIMDTVARCALILMVIALTKLYMDFDEKIGKVAWSMLLFAVFGTLSGVCKLALGMCTDLLDILLAVSDVTFWLLAIVMYVTCLPAKEKAEQLPSEEPVTEEESL